MIKLFAAIFLLFAIMHKSEAQFVKSLEKNELEKLLSSADDSLTVLNIWATWCKPCVKEIPHFEKVREQFKNQPVRFWYISLDFPDQIESRLKPFVSSRMKGAHVFYMNTVDYDKWMNKINKDWQGSIPVTLFFNRNQKKEKFEASELTEEGLIQNIRALL